MNIPGEQKSRVCIPFIRNLHGIYLEIHSIPTQQHDPSSALPLFAHQTKRLDRPAVVENIDSPGVSNSTSLRTPFLYISIPAKIFCLNWIKCCCVMLHCIFVLLLCCCYGLDFNSLIRAKYY